MFTSSYDKSNNIYYAEFVGPVSVGELREALTQCFSYPHPIRTLWQVRGMEVAFGLEEVTALANDLSENVAVPGRMAFVVGDQQFLLGVVQAVRDMRTVWRTHWEIFTDIEEAKRWLLEDESTTDD